MKVALEFHSPAFDKDGEPIDMRAASDWAVGLIEEHGPAVLLKADGVWFDTDGDLIQAPVVIVRMAVDERDVEKLVEQIHQRLRDDFGQSTAWIAVNGAVSIR